MTKPAPIALTIGEPGGIGPELALKAWQHRKDAGIQPFCLLSPVNVVEQAIKQAGSDIPFKVVSDISEAGDIFADALPVLAIDGANAISVSGTASAATANIVINSITEAVALALKIGRAHV